MSQKYTSLNTSINKNKLPKIYSLVADHIKGKKVIDYGCGKYFDNYLDKVDADLHGYDPYAKDDKGELLEDYDVAICSNVLNVIDSYEERRNVLERLKSLAPTIFITVYEGDRSGKARETKPDCWQNNCSSSNYIPELVDVFGAGHVQWVRKGYFECVSD